MDVHELRTDHASGTGDYLIFRRHRHLITTESIFCDEGCGPVTNDLPGHLEHGGMVRGTGTHTDVNRSR